jgi:hypothetical protein
MEDLIEAVTVFLFFNLPGLVILIACSVLITVFVDPHNNPWYLVSLPPTAFGLLFQAFHGFGNGLISLGL